MEALTKKGYDVNYSWGMGVHSHNMGGAMLPEMMRWLWRDQPVLSTLSIRRSVRSEPRNSARDNVGDANETLGAQ